MGYYTYAYVVEIREAETGLEVARYIYESKVQPEKPVLFSWDPGDRPAGMKDYANGTLFSSEELALLPGYPLIQKPNEPGRISEFLLEEGFAPMDSTTPVLYHLLLPARFVPRPNREPLQQPSTPNVTRLDDRLLVSYAARGGGDIRFWIERLDPKESLAQFDVNRLLTAPSSSASKFTIEINLGILKFGFQRPA